MCPRPRVARTGWSRWSTPRTPPGRSRPGAGCRCRCRSPWTPPPSATRCGPPPAGTPSPAPSSGSPRATRRSPPSSSTPAHCPDTVAELLAAAGQPAPGSRDASADPTTDGAGTVLGASAAARITALATTLLGTRIPLAVGRTARTATPAQRRALAARDKGCIIPGCGIPAEACQTHHVTDWAAGGEHRPTESGAVVLGTSPPGRPRHVDHHPHHRRRPRPPTRTRRTTRNPLARQQQRTLDHHPHTPNTLATVTGPMMPGQCLGAASSSRS